MKIRAKKSHFSVKKLFVRKQLFHKTIIWHWARASIVIFMEKINEDLLESHKPKSLKDFPAEHLGIFAVLRDWRTWGVHHYQWRDTHLQDSKYKNKVNKVENHHLEDLSDFEKHLLYAYSHRKCTSIDKCITGCIVDAVGVKHYLYWVGVAGFRHRFFCLLLPSYLCLCPHPHPCLWPRFLHLHFL